MARDNIAEDDLTVNPSEAGSATDDNNTSGDDSTTTDEGLPLIPRVRKRLSAYTVSVAIKNEKATAIKGDTSTAAAPRRRLHKKTRVASHRQSHDKQPDELDILTAVDCRCSRWTVARLESRTTTYLHVSKAFSNDETLVLW